MMLSPEWQMWRTRILRHWNRRRAQVTRLVVSVLSAMLCPFVLNSAPGAWAESALLRGFFHVTGTRPVSPDVAILQIDTRTQKALGIRANESIPRGFFADALLKLEHYRPKAVFFDAVFQDPARDPEEDRHFADALARTPSVIGRRSMVRLERMLPTGKAETTRLINNSLPLFTRAAKAVFPIQVALTANVVERMCILGNPTIEKVPLLNPLRQLVDPTIPEPGDSDLINYYGPPTTIPAIPLLRLISPENPLPVEMLRDKVLFVGWMDPTVNAIDSPGMDTLLTPTSSLPMYGVEIHATIAANLLDRSWLRRLTPVSETILFYWVTFLFAFFALSLPWRRAAFYLVGLGVVWIGASYLAFLRLNYFVPAATLFGIVLPALMSVVGYIKSRERG